MDRVALALVAGILGGAAGALAVRFVAPPSRAPSDAPATDDPSLHDLKDQVAEIRRLLDGPALASLSERKSGGRPAGAAPAGGLAEDGASSGSGAPKTSYSSDEVKAIAERAAEAVLEKRAEKEAAAKEPPKKRAPLSEVARDLNLSAGQETEIREAYREATDKFLKAMAEPDSDAETLRRELADTKGNKAKQSGLMIKYLPKMLSKFPEMMAIQGERDARVEKALGSPENHAKFQKYKIEEEDPFGLEGADMNIGVTTK